MLHFCRIRVVSCRPLVQTHCGYSLHELVHDSPLSGGNFGFEDRQQILLESPLRMSHWDCHPSLEMTAASSKQQNGKPRHYNIRPDPLSVAPAPTPVSIILC